MEQASKCLWFLALQTLIMGNRDDIDEMPSGNASVLTTVLKMVDKYDMYGSVAFPKHHKQSDVPDIYRLAAKTRVCSYSLPSNLDICGSLRKWQLNEVVLFGRVCL